MEGNALTLIDRREMTPAEAHAAYIDEKRDIIKRMCIPEKHLRNDALFENFIEISKLTGLNPIRKQLYCIDYGQGPNIVTGIDGLRLIAARSNAYGGGDEYAYEDGGESANGIALPSRASCTVYRIVGGVRCPFTCTVRWDEFGKKPFAAGYENNWKKMPYHMLGKVAESHALRRAFPEETSGLYTTDEMSQARTDDAPIREIRPASTPVERPVQATVTNTPRRAARTLASAAEKPQPNGPDVQRQRLMDAATKKGVLLHPDADTVAWAGCLDDVFERLDMDFRTSASADGIPTARDIHAAILALPTPRTVDAETGEVLDGESREEAQMSEDDKALYAATDQGKLLPIDGGR